MQLTKSFGRSAYDLALSSWQWIPGLPDKRPAFASLFGAIFLQDQTGYWWLDPVSADFLHLAKEPSTLEKLLASETGQDEYLLGGLAMAAERSGLVLAASEVYSFIVPPALGGSFELDNVEASDFVVTVDLAGQIHEQIRDLPPGTPISRITIDGRK